MIKSLRLSKKIMLSIILLSFCAFQLAVAQNRSNFGLSQPQPIATIPVGLDKPDVAFRVKKIQVTPHLILQKNGDYLLNNGWELAEGNKVIANTQSIFSQNYKSIDWYNAVVPGTVLTTLVQQGIYPDPFMGLNNLVIPDSLCRKDWWYRIAFTGTQAEANKLAWLQFDGINYRADVWLNGKMIGTLNGAFVRGDFNITDPMSFS